VILRAEMSPLWAFLIHMPYFRPGDSTNDWSSGDEAESLLPNVKGILHEVEKGDSEDRVTYGRMEFGRNFGRDPFEWWLPVLVPWRLTVSVWHLERSPELIALKIDCQV
jgi:hypothetical protein